MPGKRLLTVTALILLATFCRTNSATAQTCAALEEAKAKTGEGAFLACYVIGNEMAGAVLFRVSFVVSPSYDSLTASLNGTGRITQATNPPLNIATRLQGDYSHLFCGRGYFAAVTGYPDVVWPPNSGIGPVLLPNVHLRMNMDYDWRSGTATYKYVDTKGNWQEFGSVPVKAVPCKTN